MNNKDLQRVAQIVCNELNIKTPLGIQAVELTLQNLQTLDLKQRDYGRGNLDEFGSYGVLVRMNDKISRLKNLYKAKQRGDKQVNNESLLDSWLDAQNYSVLGAIKHLDELVQEGTSSHD